MLERLREDPPPLTDRLRNYLEWSLDDLRRLCAPAGAAAAAHASPFSTTGTTPLLEAADDLRRLSQRRGARVLLVVDQLEELLGREPANAGAAGFLQLLRASVEADHSPLTVLGTMRSDFLGLFQRHPELQGVDFESLSLGPMRIDGMRRVIEMPARLAAIEIEEGLVDRLLADAETPDALPLLSFTLAVMCRDRGDEEPLAVAAYERLGGLHGTITREADAVLAAAVREHQQDDLRKALLEMARLSEDGSYARRPVDWDTPEIQRVEPLLAQLVERRVLVSRLEGERRVIEVAHEALFRVWVPLRTWLENARAELLLRQQVERDAIAWRDGGRAPDALWRGGRLLQARDLVGRARRHGRGGEPDLAAEFVRAGVRRRTRQRATLVAVTVATIAVLAGFLAFALVQAERAKQEKRRALDMARVAIAGEWLREDPTSGALLLLEVEEPATTRFAARQLSEALNRGFIAAEYEHRGPVHSVAISADGSRVLTTSGKAALVWEARSGRLLRTLEHDEEVVDGDFDPTGRFAVTRAGEVGEHYFDDHGVKTARVWDVETGSPRFRVTHSEAINGAVFSPQGRYLVTTSDDHTAQLWDVEAKRLRYTLPHEDTVDGAAFTADGERFVTLSGFVARVWTPGSDQPVVTLTGEGEIETACFSPDGASLVTAGGNAAQAWDLPSGARGRTFRADLVRTVSFSPDGRYLLTASPVDALVWDIDTAFPLFPEPIRQRNLVFVGFSADGELIITASGHDKRRGYGSPVADDAVRYWDARTGESRGSDELQTGSEPMKIAFDAARRTVVASSAQRVGAGRYETLRENETANLWSVGAHDPRLLLTLKLDATASAASFSPDGRRVLTVAGTVAKLWDVASGKPHAALRHDGDITSAAFTTDGQAVVTASRDGTARVWDVESRRQRFVAKHPEAVEDARLVADGTLLATLSGGRSRLWRITSGSADVRTALVEMEDDGDPTGRDGRADNFSPDGKLAVVRAGETAQVWDVAARKVRFTLEHGGWVRMAAFVDGGRLLVTAGDEKVARVWDLATGLPRYTLQHAAEIEASAISPDGRTLLTLDGEGVGRLWDTATGKKRFTLRHGCGARDVQFIGGGTLAVTWSRADRFAGCDAKVVMWDVATGVAR
ncbi:MAG TPA: WD40 repeat domain-containing protein, partial [Thermoanaerobaculia bacterium]|nr:WD40 repeat domain-containing protein [Thermoanaerobaculia bacterium]